MAMQSSMTPSPPRRIPIPASRTVRLLTLMYVPPVHITHRSLRAPYRRMVGRAPIP
jgi:hypothetical protein